LLTGLAVLALTLAGCGRKGLLELPPNPAVTQSSAPGVQPSGPATAQPDGGAAQPPTINPLGWLEAPPEEQPAATPGPYKKRIILDKLLD
jgi:predicted small lipoprotein YifL